MVTQGGRHAHGRPKMNQDNMISHRLNLHQHLYGVADGHGEDGRQISLLIQSKWPELV